MATSSLDINTASFRQLLQLPGIGSTFAELIMTRRESNNFLRFEDLADVPMLKSALEVLLRDGRIYFSAPRDSSTAVPGDTDSPVPRVESAPVTMDQVSQLMATAIESAVKQLSESLVGMERRLDEKYSSFHMAPNHVSSGHQMDASGGVANPLSSDPTISRVLSAIDARTRTPPPQPQPDQSYVDRSRSAPYRNSAVSVREDEVGRGRFPKISSYDGSSDFNAFAVKFELLVSSYCWTHQTKLMKLVESLTGKALDCYAIQKAEIRDSYDLTKQQLSRMFGRVIEPMVERAEMHTITQRVGELVEQFGQRVREVATKAYADVPPDIFEMLAREAFFVGCTDKEAVKLAMSKDPSTLNDAIQFTRTAIFQDNLLRRSRPAHRRVSFENNQGSESNNQIGLKGESGNVRQLQTSSQESVLSELGKAVTKTNEILEQMVRKFSLESRSASDRSNTKSSFDRRRSRSPSPAGACYGCGETGHYRRDCPVSEPKSILRSRSPSPAPKASLN